MADKRASMIRRVKTIEALLEENQVLMAELNWIKLDESERLQEDAVMSEIITMPVDAYAIIHAVTKQMVPGMIFADPPDWLVKMGAQIVRVKVVPSGIFELMADPLKAALQAAGVRRWTCPTATSAP